MDCALPLGHGGAQGSKLHGWVGRGWPLHGPAETRNPAQRHTLGQRGKLVASHTSRRSASLTRVDLDPVRHIAHAFGVTINDVVLAASGTALKRYIEARGPLPARNLIAAVPVSAHHGHDGGELRNRVSNMMVEVPLRP